VSVAYLSLQVSTDSRRRSYSDRPDERWFADGRRSAPGSSSLRAEAALAEGPRTLLRGDAGSGKTTLLQWLAVTAARSGFSGPLAGWNGCVPFLLRLRSYADRPLPQPDQLLAGVADPLVDLLPPGWVHRQLRTGRALLLVDGVDELVPAQRAGVRTWLRGLLAEYRQLRVVVTSRPGAADRSWLTGEGFAPPGEQCSVPSRRCGATSTPPTTPRPCCGTPHWTRGRSRSNWSSTYRTCAPYGTSET
ncbi:MAG: NACHT domain-containing NTPase, partial [Pseudonocardiaceae bacterium]